MNRATPNKAASSNASADDSLRNVVDTITSFHPAIVFATTAGGVTVFGCLLVLVMWLILGPSSSPTPDVAGKSEMPDGSTASATAGTGSSASPAPGPAGVAPPGPDNVAVVRLRLHTCAIGFLAYQNSLRTLPVLPDGQRGSKLSWRVHVLPFLGQQDLYDKFNLDEAWDGPTNSKLQNEMPDLFKVSSADTSTTRFQVFTGPDSLFTADKSKKLADITDGISNTIVVAMVRPNRAIPWTKPDDLKVSTDATNQVLGTLPDGTIEAVTFDGEFVSLPANTPGDTLRSLITPSGKEIVDAGSFRPKSGLTSASELAQHGNLEALFAAAMSGVMTKREGAGAVANVPKKMKDILLAFHNFADTNRSLPASTSLSWRVHILPFVQQKPLYDQFHLDEPWDSPHNSPLVQHMPDVFRTDASDPVMTRFQVLSGEETVFVPGKKPMFRDMQDGTTNTLMVVHAGRDKATIWTKPDDLPFDSANPLAAIGNMGAPTMHCGMVDGAVVELPADLSPQTFSALVTPSGGEIVDVQSLNRSSPNATASNSPRPSKSSRESKRNAKLDKAAENVASNPDAIRAEENKMKQIALAFHNFSDTYRHLPWPDGKEKYDRQGNPHLSWRVYLLPFLDQEPLYNKFKLNEPWDSPHNKPLLEFMPDVFRATNDPSNSTTTQVVVMTGKKTSFEKHPGPNFSEFRDGTSQTLLCFQVDQQHAVPWSQPVDAVFDPNQPLAALGKIPPHGLTAARADGAVFRIAPTIGQQQFAAIVTMSGGEVLSPDDRQILGFRH